eukprot:gene595-769_t
MSGKGNCYDNAMVETVFKTLKSELVWRTTKAFCSGLQKSNPVRERSSKAGQINRIASPLFPGKSKEYIDNAHKSEQAEAEKQAKR